MHPTVKKKFTTLSTISNPSFTSKRRHSHCRSEAINNSLDTEQAVLTLQDNNRRMVSLTPFQTANNQAKISPENKGNRISINIRSPLYSRKVKSSMNTHQTNQSSPQKDGLSLDQLKQQCCKIFRRKTHANEHTPSLRFAGKISRGYSRVQRRSKTTKQSYKVIEPEPLIDFDNSDEGPTEESITREYIHEMRRDKMVFKKTLQYFNRRISTLTTTYFDSVNMNLNPKVYKGLTLKGLQQRSKVKSGYVDDVYQFTKGRRKGTRKYDFKKQDVFLYLRSSNKIVNPQKLRQSERRFSSQLGMQDMIKRKSTEKKVFTRTENIRFYKKYLRISEQRKNIINQTIPQEQC